MTMTKTKGPMHVAPGSLSYLTDLVKKRQVQPGQTAADSLAELTHWLARPPKPGKTKQQEVSDMIDRVKKLPSRTVYAPVAVKGSSHTAYVPYPAVPESVPTSKFAVLTELLAEIPASWKGQEYLFFEVKTLKHKRVVRRLLGAPGKFKRNTLPAALATELFGHLGNQAFAYQAAKTFGEIYSVCGRCGAELTDDTSREHKFGPICWDLMAPYREAFETA